MFFLLFGVIFSSCRKEMDFEFPPSNLKMISKFELRKSDNPSLSGTKKATIVENKKAITLKVNSDADVTALKPNFINAPGSTVVPGNLEPQDFTIPVDYTVTAENGTSIYYTVTVVVEN